MEEIKIYKVYYDDDNYEICHSILQIIDFLKYVKTWNLDLTITVYYKDKGQEIFSPWFCGELEESLSFFKKLAKNT